MAKNEMRACQSCKEEFTIEPEDFSFYERILVPPPTWCPECRMMRRLQSRNERTLYHFKCKLCGSPGISMYAADSPFPVYCVNCWYSDKWDQLSYGRTYDFSRPFFEQWRELSLTVPRASIFHRNVTNARYSNIVGEARNVYLSYSVSLGGEGIYFSKFVDQSNNIFDCLGAVDSNQCYGSITVQKDYHCKFAYFSQNCIDCSFIFDCSNCHNCFLSTSLRNREYVIRNKQYSKEEYFSELEKMDLGSASNMEKIEEEFHELMLKAPHRYASILKSTESTGDNIVNSKNARMTFDAYNMEDTKYVFRAYGLKGARDSNNAGNSELVYEFSGGGALGSSMLLFSSNGIQALQDVSYSDYCANDAHLFGCVSLRDKKYCILNRQYSKEEYETLVPKIKKHMDEMPYIDAKGRIYKYGEFFPPEILAFAYNETIAQEHFPLTKEEAERQGFKWKELEEKHYQATKKSEELPDNIKDVDDSILKEVIECLHKGGCKEQCTTAFKIVPEELSFYRRENLPLPRLCPNCRHYGRLAEKNPMKLWHRQCMCNKTNHGHSSRCSNEFETPYAPERKEVIYCEECYQKEVV